MSHQVGSNAGIVGMTKEHLGLALALNVPVFVVVTKIDMCPANILQGMEIVLIDVLLHEEMDVSLGIYSVWSHSRCRWSRTWGSSQ